MIDWLTFVAPLEHAPGPSGPLFAGQILSFKSDPASPGGISLEWGVEKRLSLEGSYSNTVQVRSTHDYLGRPAIWVSGSPAKWFQGHNIFGSDNLPGLVREMLERIASARGITPTGGNRDAWWSGDIELGRVDSTRGHYLGTLPLVRSFIQSASCTAHMKFRGRGDFMGDSLVFGVTRDEGGKLKGSRRWTCCLYAKGAELVKHPLPVGLPGADELFAYAQGLLRSEVRVLKMQLREEGLQWVRDWRDNTALELHQRLVAGLRFSEQTMINDDRVGELRPLVRDIYRLWFDGHDVRAGRPKATFYRARAELLELGIDIAVKRPRVTSEPSNVVPLRTVLHAYPADVPQWARGTALYFEPARVRVA